MAVPVFSVERAKKFLDYTVTLRQVTKEQNPHLHRRRNLKILNYIFPNNLQVKSLIK